MFARLSLAATTLAFALGLPLSAAATDDDQAAFPPSVEEIIRILKAREDAIETLQVTSLCLEEITLLKPGAKHDANFPIADNLASMNRKAEIAWEVTREGAGRMTAKMQCTNTRDDGTTFDSRETILSTCAGAGAGGRWLETDRQRDGADLADIGRATQNFQLTHVGPFDFTTRQVGTPISKILADGEAKFIETQRWDERPVVVLEAKPKAIRDDYILRQRFWVDVERGVAVRRQSLVQRGEGKPWGLHYQVDATKYAEAAPGVWLPGRVDTLNYHVSDEGQDFLTSKARFVITDWIVNKKIDASRFDVDLPEQAPDPSRPQPVPAHEN